MSVDVVQKGRVEERSTTIINRLRSSLGRVTAIGWALFAVALAVLMLLPLVPLEQEALSNIGSTFQEAEQIVGIGATLINTVLLGVGSVIFALCLGTLLAWSINRLPPRARLLLGPLPMAPMIIPPVAFVVGWTFLLSARVGYFNQLLRLLPWWSSLDSGPLDPYSFPMIVIMTGLILTPFVYMFVLSAIAGISPEFEAAALTSGAGEWRAFRSITLPMVRPALIYSAGVVLLLGLGQFTVPLLLGRARHINVLTTEIYLLREHYPVNYGLAALLGLPLLISGALILLAQHKGLGNVRRFVTLSANTASYVRPKINPWAYLLVGVFGLGIILAPLLALVYVALSPFWSGQLALENMSMQHVTAVFEDQAVRESILRSIRLSTIAGVITLPIGFVAAQASLRRLQAPRIIQVIIEFMGLLPLGIPAALLGLGILFAYTIRPFGLFDSEWVIVIAYVTIMVPFAMRALASTLVAIGPEFAEAAQIAGAGPLRIFGRITLPLARRGIASAISLVIILLFHEFAATVMVAGPRNQLMGSVLYKHWIDGSLPRVAVVALIMVAVTSLGVFAAFAIGSFDSRRRSAARG
ncbi:MAG: iron ABC transporter permease [Alphaproteobacteria bacterium]